MKARSICAGLVVAACLGFIAPSLWAQDGLEGAFARENPASSLNLTASIRQALAVADFDSDQKLDGAVLTDSGRLRGQSSYRIELHLSGSNNSELTFQSTETALAITASDVNNDGKPDVVIERALSHRRLYVWLNDGHGKFHKGRVEDFPSTEATGGEHAHAPTSSADYPALCLPQQRGSETAMLAASFLRARPPSTSKITASSVAPLPVSSAFSLDSPRAPPSFSL